MDLRSLGSGEQGDEEPYRPRPEHGEPIARSDVRRLGSPKRVAAGFHERAEHAVHAIGKRVERRDRHDQLLRERPRPAVPDAHLEPVGTDMLRAAPAATAAAAAEHRVAHDPPPDPVLIDPVADRRDDPAPFVADAHRVAGLTVVEVGHPTREELGVRAAHTGPLDVDDDLADRGDWLVDLLHGGTARSGDDERTQRLDGARVRSRGPLRRSAHAPC